ncbi:hypothetical protein J3459_022387 [Metarhizium acridum]|nr:hypothetical protein J3459_022387 [Metarhizium acridum]
MARAIRNKPVAGESINKNGVSSDSIVQMIAQSTDMSTHDLSPDIDLFGYGMDSLQVILVSNEINKPLLAKDRPPSFDPQTVCANPTISSLLAAVSTIVEGRDVPENHAQMVLTRMKEMYHGYMSDLPLSGRRALLRPSHKSFFLVTASTRSLGSYMLDSLISNTEPLCLSRVLH